MVCYTSAAGGMNRASRLGLTTVLLSALPLSVGYDAEECYDTGEERRRVEEEARLV